MKIDVDALSGILGSISITAWVVVFTPQIVENFRRSSADGLSVLFIIIWLLGDVFNIIGALLQHVLPTMIILAVYYTLADVILLGQCLWYKGWTLKDKIETRRDQSDGEEEAIAANEAETVNEESPLISRSSRGSRQEATLNKTSEQPGDIDPAHLSPATPFVAPSNLAKASPPSIRKAKARSTAFTFLFNTFSLILVCVVGVLCWWLAQLRSTSGNTNNDDAYIHLSPTVRHRLHPFITTTRRPKLEDGNSGDTSTLHLDLWGQVFGYLCAALYLGSRLPQLLLNYRRKSTDGVSLLFFLFACVGNLTYVLSIFAYEPSCARLQDFEPQVTSRSSLLAIRGDAGNPVGCESGEWATQYKRYILVNTSWLIGSAGTLLLDLIVFVQFWIYRNNVPTTQQAQQEEEVS